VGRRRRQSKKPFLIFHFSFFILPSFKFPASSQVHVWKMANEN
jgi:hypothetical protein